MPNEKNAVFILIDNSAISIDGDFYPTRLDAQIITTMRYADMIYLKNPDSKIAIGTLSDIESGIRCSFTNTRLKQNLCNITCVGNLNLQKGIKCAVLALHSSFTQNERKKILAFIGSNNDLTEKVAEELIQLLISENISIYIVAFGDLVPNKSILEKMSNHVSNSFFLYVPHSNTTLSDDVLSSFIGQELNPSFDHSEIDKNVNLLENQKSDEQKSNQSTTIQMMLQDVKTDDKMPKTVQIKKVTATGKIKTIKINQSKPSNNGTTIEKHNT